MQARIYGMLTGVTVRDKYENGQKKVLNGEVVKDRKAFFVDFECEDEDSTVKVNLQPEQVDALKSSIHQQGVATLTVHKFKNFTFYRLVSFVPQSDKKAA